MKKFSTFRFLRINFLGRNLKGFTLLELLVVIGIIAVLLGLGSVSFSSAQKKARDAKRASDLQSMQKYLEQCYSISSYVYPNTTAPATLTGSTTSTITATCTADSTTFAITNPTTLTYTITTSTTTTYRIETTLENGALIYISQQQ